MPLFGSRTSSASGCSAHSAGTVCIGAFGVFFVGVVVMIWGIIVMNTRGIQEVSTMFEVDAGMTEESSPDPTEEMTIKVMEAVLVIVLAGFSTMVVAVVGCAGTVYEFQGVLCTYFTAAGFLAAFYVVVSMSTLQFTETLGPVADRQAEQFCNASFHQVFARELKCSHEMENSTRACGEECHKRVDLLRQMGGCKLLGKLCHDYDYNEVGTGMCLQSSADSEQAAPGLPTAAWQANLDFDACRKTCNLELSCVGFTFTSHESFQACIIVAQDYPRSANVPWIASTYIDATPKVGPPVAASGSPEGSICYAKDTPMLVANIIRLAKITSTITFIAFLILVVASTCACFRQYTLVTKRQGNKGAGMLCCKMLCPCCEKRARRKFPLSEKEDEDASETEVLSPHSEDEVE